MLQKLFDSVRFDNSFGSQSEMNPVQARFESGHTQFSDFRNSKNVMITQQIFMSNLLCVNGECVSLTESHLICCLILVWPTSWTPAIGGLIVCE